MAEEREVRTMSVELAMQRELAYRKKVASIFGESVMKDLIPLESELPSSTTIPSSNQSTKHISGLSPISPLSHQTLFQNQPCHRPSSVPKPGPGSSCRVADTSMAEAYRGSSSIAASKPSPVQSQDPSPCQLPSLNMESTPLAMHEETTTVNGNLLCLPYQQPQNSYIGNTPYLFCKVCKVSCSGPLNYEQHLKGHKHKAKLQMLQMSREVGGNKKHQKPRCNICQIWCTDENTLELHFKGQKHKAKLQEIELDQKGKTSQQLWCELCGVPCTNKDGFNLHLKGKNHVARLFAMGEKTRAI